MASYLDRLIKEFGTTHDAYSGGFLLYDGSFLDLSDGSGRRIIDHRAVIYVLPQKVQDKFDYRYDAMVYLCKKVLMYRWSPESWNLEAWTKPSRSQLDIIEQLAQAGGRYGDDKLGIEARRGRQHHYEEYMPYDSEYAWRDLYDFYN